MLQGQPKPFILVGEKWKVAQIKKNALNGVTTPNSNVDVITIQNRKFYEKGWPMKFKKSWCSQSCSCEDWNVKIKFDIFI